MRKVVIVVVGMVVVVSCVGTVIIKGTGPLAFKHVSEAELVRLGIKRWRVSSEDISSRSGARDSVGTVMAE